MRVLTVIACLGVVLAACEKTEPATKAPETAKMSVEEKAKNDGVLATLTKEQQAAVRLLVRDTLVSDPHILLEAQQAYEAIMIREQNEQVATAYSKIKNEESQIAFGPANARITVIEYFDYKCGFCHAANSWLIETMNKRRDIRYIFKELPILSANSTLAAKAAMAAHAQGKYLEFHRALMGATGDLGLEQIMSIAESVGLNTTRLRTDMNKPEYAQRLEKIRNQATEVGINGTPGFLINGKLISGFAKDQLEAMIGAESDPSAAN
jgi:protein-disulfide isomerase